MATSTNSELKIRNISLPIEKCSRTTAPTSLSYENSTSTEDCEVIAYQNNSILMLFVLITSVCVLVNARIIYVMLVNTNRNNRYVNLLVAHFSTIIFLYCDVFLFRTFEKQLVNLFPLAGFGFCEIFTFFQNMVNSAFPLNAVALIYERMQAINKPFQKVHLINCLSGIWLVSLLTSIPTIFMVKYSTHPIKNFEHCKETLLFNYQEITITFEWTRYLILCLAVCLYMAYVIYKVWGKVRSFDGLQGNRFRNWETWPERMKFVFIHSILFLLIWLPKGTARFFNKDFCTTEKVQTVVMNRDVGPFYLIPRKVLGVICRKSPPMIPPVPPISAEDQRGNWRRIPLDVTTRNEGDGVSTAMSMLGCERADRFRDTGTSPITTLEYNFNPPNVTFPICIDCEDERRKADEQTRRQVNFQV